MLGLLGELDGCAYEPLRPPDREDAIDELLLAVEEALDVLLLAFGPTEPGWPSNPTPEELVLCLCGEPPEREGDWRGLSMHLRVRMAHDWAVPLGRC